MKFVQVLADLFDLRVEREGEAVRLSIPPPEDEEKWKNVVVPNVMVIMADGVPMPVDYELRNGVGEDSPL